MTRWPHEPEASRGSPGASSPPGSPAGSSFRAEFGPLCLPLPWDGHLAFNPAPVTLTEEVKRLYGCSRLGLNILGLFAWVRSPGSMVSCPVPLRGASGGWSIGVNGADLDFCLVLDGEQLSLMVFLQFYWLQRLSPRQDVSWQIRVLYYGFSFSCNVSRVTCSICFFYLNVSFFMGLVGRQLPVTKQAEIGQGTQKLQSTENIIYIKLPVSKTRADTSWWKFFYMHLHLVSFPPMPELPLFQFLCGRVLPAGQGMAWSRAALAIVCMSCFSGRSEALSGELMAVLSSCEGRIQFHFFLGRKVS